MPGSEMALEFHSLPSSLHRLFMPAQGAEPGGIRGHRHRQEYPRVMVRRIASDEDTQAFNDPAIQFDSHLKQNERLGGKDARNAHRCLNAFLPNSIQE